MRYNFAQVQKIPVGAVCTSISDTFKGNAQQVVLVNTSDVLEGNVLNHQYVPNKNLKGQFKKTFCKGDILFSEIRPQNRRFAFVDFNPCNYIASTKLMVLRADQQRILPHYLYYLVTSDLIITELQMLAETRSGTFPQITFSELSNIIIPVPPLNVQQGIIDIVKCIDDKIELNQKINESLERQVQAIFQSWFVNFEPFGGEKPVTWSNTTLGAITKIASGKRPPMKQPQKTSSASIPLVGASSIMGFTNAALYDEKILITGRVGTHGVIQRFSSKCWASDNTLVIISKFYEFVYQVLQTIDYQNMNRGSTQPLITQTDLKNSHIVLPTTEWLQKFEALAGALMAKYEANRIENVCLAKLRDELLPKLISGEIDISNDNGGKI